MSHQVTQVFSGHDFNVVVVESVSSGVYQLNDSFFFVTGHVKPVAIVVLGPDVGYAVDMDANVSDIKAMQRQIPELLSLIKPFVASR